MTYSPTTKFQGDSSTESTTENSLVMALDKTPEKQAHYEDWVKYLVSADQIETAVNQNSAIELPPEKVNKISENGAEFVSTQSFEIGGKTSLEFNYREISNHFDSNLSETEPKEAKIQVNPEPQSLIAKAPKSEKSNNNGILKEIGVDFGLFHQEIVAPLLIPAFKAVKTGISWFNDLLSEHVFFTLSKPKNEEQKKKEATQKVNKQNFLNTLKQNTEKANILKSKKNAQKVRIMDINRTLGNQNLNYEGILDENGDIRKDVLNAVEKANSEKSKEQIAQDKKRKMLTAMQSSKPKGPQVTFSQDKAHNANNAAKLSG